MEKRERERMRFLQLGGRAMKPRRGYATRKRKNTYISISRDEKKIIHSRKKRHEKDSKKWGKEEGVKKSTIVTTAKGGKTESKIERDKVPEVY